MGFIVGLLIGVAIVTVGVIYVTRNYMLVKYKVDGSFDKVTQAVEEVIPSFPGWGFPIPSWNFYKSQLEKNLVYDNITNMMLYFVCKPKHANSVLSVAPQMAGIMPCTWAVYETTDGSVYIAKMNIGLMGLLFSGIIKKTMKDVAQSEEQMFAKIREKLGSSNKKRSGLFSAYRIGRSTEF